MDRVSKFLSCLSSFLTRSVCTSILMPVLALSLDIQAQESAKITRYTLQREKTPEPEVLPLPQRKHDVTNYTLQRDKTPESTQLKPQAVNLPEIEIVENSGAYQIKVVAVIAAPARFVRNVLTDYTHIYRLNPSIIESEVLQRDNDGSVEVRTRVIGCAAYFCEELDRVEKVQLLPSGDIVAEIVPEKSQFKSGITYWQIKAVGERCQVTYQSNVEPDIFIPPVVGKFLIKKSIRQEMQVSFANLEKISSVMAARDWQQENQFVDSCGKVETAMTATCAAGAGKNLSVME
jgi:hypothetical protein